jgi:hypothetical protein
MNSSTINKSFQAEKVRFTDVKMTVVLYDGREITVPLAWFPTLKNASKKQLKNWRFIGEGEGIHWEELDEDILVENLFV